MSAAFLLHPARRAIGGGSRGRRFLRGGHARRSSVTLAVRLAIVWGLALLALIIGLMLTLPTLAHANDHRVETVRDFRPAEFTAP